MEAALLCAAVVWFSALSVPTGPARLPEYAPEPLEIHLSPYVRGLQGGKDRSGLFVRQQATGQNLLGSHAVLPCGQADLQDYRSLARDAATRGFKNPYTAILAELAVAKFGSFTENEAMYPADEVSDHPPGFDAACYGKWVEFMRNVAAVRPILAMECDDVLEIYYLTFEPGEYPKLGVAALCKRGDAYFLARRVPHTDADQDVMCALSEGTTDHRWPLPLFITK